MGYYVMTDGDGSCRDAVSDKYVPIRDFKKATKWDSIAKASNILNNAISKSIRNKLAIQYIDTDSTVEKRNKSLQSSLCSYGIIDDNINNWLSEINAIIEIMSDSIPRQQELNAKLSNIDKEIVDIEHYIEFGNGKFNAYEGWKCFKMLQNLLVQRRKYKNELQALNLIGQCQFNRDSLIALSKEVSNIKNKHYIPRALPGLFKSKT